MKAIDILGDNRFEQYTKIRRGSRGIVLNGELILLTWEKETDVWMIPGGGAEGNETPEACCVREVQEETGLMVRPIAQFLEMNEYYEEYRYISDYFFCETVGMGEKKLTKAEEERGLISKWIPIQDALSIFGNHAAYAATDEEKRGIYFREFTALKAFLDFKDQES